MLSKSSRILLAVSALLLTAAFLFPLWRITLQAPQYPEGLGLEIRVNTVTGVQPQDLQNINGLNHYIGMKAIEPDSIPELTLMPIALGALIVSGLVVAVLGRRTLARVWVALFLVGSLAGVADFWYWQYDYGHNLDVENAPIKVPGMTYQPPLFGTKKLLNFTATAWPGWGGWAAFGSLALALLAVSRGRAGVVAPTAARATPAPRPASLGTAGGTP